MSEGLPERLRKVRAHCRLSATDMADRVGLGVRKTWERYEKGETRPNAETLAALVDLGIDATWLLTGAGSMLPVPPLPSAAGQDMTADDRMYQVAIAAALRWYDKAGLDVDPEGMARLVTRSVRILRVQPRVDQLDDGELGAEISRLLDLARDMLRAAGWSPKSG